MKLCTKLRWTYLVSALGPLAVMFWMSRQTILEQNAQYSQVMAAGVISAICIGLAGPGLTKNWVFLKQIKAIEHFCLSVKEGHYGASLKVPNENRDKDEENEIINLMRHLNWMAHHIGRRETDLRRSLQALSESHREVREKSLSLETANQSLRQAQILLQAQTSELEQAFSQMQRLAMTDALTQIGNRRFFFESLHQYLAVAQQGNQHISLLILDIDHFKLINDQYGHQAGDWVLSEFAARLRNCIRHSDIAARIGGEEFGLLLPDTDDTGASTIANRIYAVINQQDFLLPNLEARRITASLGVCSLQPGVPYPALDVFVNYADKALYCCKRKGRDGIYRYDPVSHLIHSAVPKLLQSSLRQNNKGAI